jgi:hypothetical protein
VREGRKEGEIEGEEERTREREREREREKREKTSPIAGNRIQCKLQEAEQLLVLYSVHLGFSRYLALPRTP